ncbi:MAG: signal transduction histidine kinase/ActR/RegA family two-component response regulator [Glaciecola sp.]|jgi:signal transduction histidine kinase/ActR/RegA family two-component response regulator
MELLQPVAFFFAILYSLLAIAHFFLLHESFKWILFGLAFVTAIVAALIGFKAFKISSGRQSFVILLLMLAASLNSLTHLWFSEAPEQSTNIFVTIIASGIVLSNRKHWTVSILFSWIGWLSVYLVLNIALAQHFFFAMAMSTLLSWFAHLARRSLVEKQIELAKERDVAIYHEREAMAATEAKSAFLANMSHEIRTPMNGVIGMIELLSEQDLDETQKKDYLATAKRSAESLMFVINDILDFSKIEARELTIEQVQFDIEIFFTNFIHDQQFQVNKKGLELVLEKPTLEETTVVGDPHRITQVLNNLVSNAIKFTSSGTIIIRYELNRHDEQYLLDVVVSDTGIGISNASLPHLFDSFSQADTSTTRKFGGTGLGLAITKQLCELMGGGVSVKSSLGEGSAFHVSVVLLTPNSAAVAEETLKLMSSDINFSNMRVLIVEDNHINQEVLKAILTGLKIQIEIASNGQEAINLLSRKESAIFDLVLMDCQMPIIDGYEATRRIRAGHAGELLKEIPIVALTANTLNSEREKCFQTGMDDHLSKPIDINALKLILMKYQPAK